ncbi:protein L [Acinetobacter baumannii]|nr:protein L [Acinetobacter baumannii]
MDGAGPWWKETYSPGKIVPVSGIYKCTICDKEIASNKDDPFPPQNHHQHPEKENISWTLVIRADTKNEWR